MQDEEKSCDYSWLFDICRLDNRAWLPGSRVPGARCPVPGSASPAPGRPRRPPEIRLLAGTCFPGPRGDLRHLTIPVSGIHGETLEVFKDSDIPE